MIGQRINNYEVVDQIGEGGMGAVYMARHPFIDRRVAVKVLRASLANDPAVVQRFFNEAKAANAIRHPNIIDILDVGLLPDGRTPYLMMELLEGENVAQRLKRTTTLSVSEAVNIAIQTASAVSAAHAQGIVHRDLKPENLFIVRDRRSGEEVVKVLDFGIAKLRGTLSGNHVKTQTGALMGTPPYMSPEQCRGISTEVDHRTDIYAIGIILYEMLCGAPPFVGEGFGDVLVQHLTRPPEPPRSRNPAIPGSLERVILRALAKTLEQRYLTMADLQSALEGKAVPEPPTLIHAPTQALSTGVALSLSPTPASPFQRQTTTLSSNTGEMESAVDMETAVEPPRSRRNLFAGAGAAAVVAAVVLIFALRSPSGADIDPKSAGTGHTSVAVVPQPPRPIFHPDAGAATAPATTRTASDETPRPHPVKKTVKPVVEKPVVEKPVAKPDVVTKPVVTKPAGTPRTRPADQGMGKW